MSPAILGEVSWQWDTITKQKRGGKRPVLRRTNMQVVQFGENKTGLYADESFKVPVCAIQSKKCYLKKTNLEIPSSCSSYTPSQLLPLGLRLSQWQLSTGSCFPRILLPPLCRDFRFGSCVNYFALTPTQTASTDRSGAPHNPPWFLLPEQLSSAILATLLLILTSS